MTVLAHTKTIKRRRRRRLTPSKRLIKNKSLYPRRTIYLRRGKFIVFKHRTQRQRVLKRFNLYWAPSKPSKASKPYKPKPRAKKPFKAKPTPKKRGRKKKYVSAWDKTQLTREQGLDWKRKHPTFNKKHPATSIPKGPRVNRAIKDTSKWRSYNTNTVAVMKALGPKLIFELTPTKQFFFHYGVWSKKSGINAQNIMRLTRESMEDMLAVLLKYAKEVIGKYVPCETGDLREAMVNSIARAKIRRYGVKVELDTGSINYANVVDKMIQKRVRHHTNMGKRGRRSHSLLDDPLANSGYFSKIQMILNAKAKELIAKMMIDIQNIWIMKVVHPDAPPIRVPPRVPPGMWRKVDSNETPPQLQRHRAKNIKNDMRRHNKKFGKGVAKKMGQMGHEDTRPTVAYIYPRHTYKIWIPASEEDKIRAKYADDMDKRARIKKRNEMTTTMEYGLRTIKSFFKIRGLYKT